MDKMIDIKDSLMKCGEFSEPIGTYDLTIRYDADAYIWNDEYTFEYIIIDIIQVDHTSNSGSYFILKNYYFHLNSLDIAIDQFIKLLNFNEFNESSSVDCVDKSISKIDIIAIEYGLHSLNHYDYLDCVIEDFWKLVFNKSLNDTWNAGIITAHGDKGSGYKSDWLEAGIPYNRGMLLYLLTYTNELGDTPKYKSCQWVIDNYLKYLPKIELAEKNYMDRLMDKIK